MEKEAKWYQSAQQDWDLIMAQETDRTVTCIEYDELNMPRSRSAKSAASMMVKDLANGIVLKPRGSGKWLRGVEREFLICWNDAKDYMAQAELNGIVPRVMCAILKNRIMEEDKLDTFTLKQISGLLSERLAELEKRKQTAVTLGRINETQKFKLHLDLILINDSESTI
jgi:hypothetical protein